MAAETFRFVWYDHVVGDVECDGCWSGSPTPHDCGTPGCLRHTEFGDENYDGFWLYETGDLCRDES